MSHFLRFLAYAALDHLPNKIHLKVCFGWGVGMGHIKRVVVVLELLGEFTPPHPYPQPLQTKGKNLSQLLFLGGGYAAALACLKAQSPDSAPEVIPESIFWLQQVLRDQLQKFTTKEWDLLWLFYHFDECFKCTFLGRLFISCPNFIFVLINDSCIQFLCLFNEHYREFPMCQTQCWAVTIQR